MTRLSLPALAILVLEPEINADRHTDRTEKAPSGTLTLTLVSSLLAAGYLNAMTGLPKVLLCVPECCYFSIFSWYYCCECGAATKSMEPQSESESKFSLSHTHTSRLYKAPEPVLTQEMMCHRGQELPDAQYVSAQVGNYVQVRSTFI